MTCHEKGVSLDLDMVLRHASEVLESSRSIASELGHTTNKVRDIIQQALVVAGDEGLVAHSAALEECIASLVVSEQQANSSCNEVTQRLERLQARAEQLCAEFEGLQARSQIGERIIRAQEEERQRLARELHDGPAQALANIVLRAEICERLLAAGRQEVTQELAQMKLLVKESLREVRKIIFDLRPMTLDDLGLTPTLRRYFENMREHIGPQLYMQVVGPDERLPTAVEVAAFRTVQEAVNNARRHAQATRIDVTLRFEPQTLHVTVADDGVGFDFDQVRRELKDRPSFGLLGMQERVELLAGQFSLRSDDQGTIIELTIPTRDA